jgi:hypothetical protein
MNDMPSTIERVSLHTADSVNERIHRDTEKNILYYSRQNSDTISQRLKELDQEWDMERILETNAATAAILSTLLGTFVSRKWYLFPALIGGFLLQHAIEGWCPPVPLFRRLGFRTSREIETERHALCRRLQEIKNQGQS